MKIILRKGKKVEGDKIIYIQAETERLTMMDVAGMINQFALNEFLIIDKEENFSREKHFWFGHLINKAIEDAKGKRDWFKLSLEDLIELEDYPYFVKEWTIKKFIEERENED